MLWIISFTRRQESSNAQNVNAGVRMDPCLRRGDTSGGPQKVLITFG